MSKDKPEKWIEKIERIVKQPKLDQDSYNKDWERYTREEIILNELLPYVRKLIKQKQAEAYEQGVSDEIECVETSGEHLNLQKKLKQNNE